VADIRGDRESEFEYAAGSALNMLAKTLVSRRSLAAH
jgi:hypothetical protein